MKMICLTHATRTVSQGLPSTRGMSPADSFALLRSPDMVSLIQQLQQNSDDCWEQDGSLCSFVYNLTNGNETLASGSEWLVLRPLQILGIVVVAVIVNRVLKRRVRAFVKRILSAQPEVLKFGATLHDPRRETRATATAGVLSGAVSTSVWVVTLMLIAGVIGLALGPLIAGAGIVGLALGFGSQSLVKDWISGLFMLMEDQYGIGDVVDLGPAIGVVERFSLRSTVIRSLNGTVWHIPNGEITRVGNLSQVWSMALVEVAVAYQTNLDTAIAVMTRTAEHIVAREEFASNVLEPPVVTGVEQLGDNGITIRLMVKTAAGAQWDLQRALRKAVKENFQSEGIEIPFPQRDVWLRQPTEE
jgi:moderate conductance mechanosensitive channel